jgi:hypothetical protein
LFACYSQYDLVDRETIWYRGTPGLDDIVRSLFLHQNNDLYWGNKVVLVSHYEPIENKLDTF